MLRISELQKQEFKRILLIKPSAVGDVIHTLPVLARLRARYPGARIDWMLTPHIAELVRHNPALSNVVLFARESYGRPWKDWRSPWAFARMLAELRGAEYDLVIDLHGQLRSAFFSLVTGAPTRIGFDRPRKRLRRAGRDLPPHAYGHAWKGAREGSWAAYTHRIPIPTLDAHAIDRYLWVGDLLGFPPGPPRFDLPLPPEAPARAAQLLGRNGAGEGPIALITPGTIWETKHWLPGNFGEVGQALAHMGFVVVLAGSARDKPACAAVAARCPKAINLCGQTTLTELASLVRRAAICVTNDSGPMHLAAALGTPLVSIFGPTDPLWIGPYGRPEAVVRAGIACSPCYLRRLRECPHDHACMHQVTSAMVIARIEQVLAGTAVGSA